MSKPRVSLAAFQPIRPELEPTLNERGAGKVVGLTLRISHVANLQLKSLAIELEGDRGERVLPHHLLVEAVNDLFRKYGKNPIA